METRTFLAALTITVLLIVCTACGGGTSNPAPVFPDVTELTEADLAGADVPPLPPAVSSVSRASSLFGSDACKDVFEIDPTTATVNNLLGTTYGGDGYQFTTSGVAEDTTKRIIAWALFELPPGANMRSRELQITLNGDVVFSTGRVFAAVSNFSAGKWEPIGRITGEAGATIAYTLSPLQRYNRSADGAAYLLLLVGHPGTADVNGISFNFEEIKLTSFDTQCLADLGPEDGAVDWGDGIVSYEWDINNDGVWDLDNDGQIMQMQASVPQQLGFLVPQPLNLLTSPEYFSFQSLVGDFDADSDVDGADFLFFDPSEVNGPRHAYSLTVDLGGGNDTVNVNVSPIWVPQGSPANALIGLLVPAVQAASKTLSLHYDNGDPTPVTVSPRGEVMVDSDLAVGNYRLESTELGLDIPFSVVESVGTKYFSWGEANQG